MDTVVRFGGDEFVVTLRELDADKAMSTEQVTGVAEKIRLSVAKPYQLAILMPGQIEHVVEPHCSASIGMVVYINHQASQDDILKWANAAMYQAKDAGRNTIRLYELPQRGNPKRPLTVQAKP